MADEVLDSRKYKFRYVRSAAGTLSGPSFIFQTEEALSDLGNTAIEASEEALANSQQALVNSENALSIADAARSDASEALSVAYDARERAVNATAIANEAKETADEALGRTESLEPRVDALESAVAAAQETADEALAEARTAQEAADENAEKISETAVDVSALTQDVEELKKKTEDCFVDEEDAVDLDELAGEEVRLYVEQAGEGFPEGARAPAWVRTEMRCDDEATLMWLRDAEGTVWSREGTYSPAVVGDGSDDFSLSVPGVGDLSVSLVVEDGEIGAETTLGDATASLWGAGTGTLHLVLPMDDDLVDGEELIVSGTVVAVVADGAFEIADDATVQGSACSLTLDTASADETEGLLDVVFVLQWDDATPAESGWSEWTRLGSGNDEYMPISGGTFTGGYFGTTVAVGSDGVVDASKGSVFALTLSEDLTLTFAGVPEGAAACFSLLVENETGASVVWPDSVIWSGGSAPELPEGETTVLTFLSPDGGTTWHAATSGAEAGSGSGGSGDGCECRIQTFTDPAQFGMTLDDSLIDLWTALPENSVFMRAYMDFSDPGVDVSMPYGTLFMAKGGYEASRGFTFVFDKTGSDGDVRLWLNANQDEFSTASKIAYASLGSGSDGADAVTLGTEQTITGVKTFGSVVETTSAGRESVGFYIQLDEEYDAVQEGSSWPGIWFVDKNYARMAKIEYATYATSQRRFAFAVSAPYTDYNVDSEQTVIYFGYDADGNKMFTVDNKVVSPTGAIALYAGTSTPAGWLLCNGANVSRTTYADLFSAIGTTWGSGDGSTTFALPDFRDRFPEGAGSSYSVGKSVSAGLPELSGYVRSTVDIGIFPNNGNTYTSSGGLAKYTGITSSCVSYGSASSTTQILGLNLDGSKSSSLYGASSTTQPQALAVYYIIKT